MQAGKVEDELHLFIDCPSYAHLRQDFFEKIKSILGEVNQKVFNKRQMLALLNSNSPKLLNIIVNFMNKCMSKRNSSQSTFNITNKMSTFSLYIYIFIYQVCKYKCMQADATVAPTCIDIIYILHVYLSLCVITIYCKCVSTNKYCLLSIVNPWDD